MSSSLSEAASVGRPSSRSRREPVVATPSVRPLALPLAFTLALIALSFIPSVSHHPVLRWSFWGAGAFLLAFQARTLDWKRTKEAVFLTAKTTAMVCWLFVGSALFSGVFAILGG